MPLISQNKYENNLHGSLQGFVLFLGMHVYYNKHIYIHVVEYIMYTLNCLRRMALPNGSNIDNTLK